MMKSRSKILSYYLYMAVDQASFWMIGSIYVVYLQQTRGLNLTQVGITDAVFWLMMAVAEIPTGTVADRYGRKFSLAIGSILGIVAFLFYGLAPTFFLIILANVVWAISVTFHSGAAEAFLYETLKSTDMAASYVKISGRASAIRTATVVAAILGGIIGEVNLKLPFFVGAVGQGILFCIVMTFKEPQAPRTSGTQVRLSYREILSRSVRALGSNPRLRIAIVYLTFVPIASFLVAVLFLQPKAISAGVPIRWIGLVVFSANALRALGSFSSARIAKMIKVKSILVPVILLAALCLLFAGMVESLAGLIFIGILGFLIAAVGPIVNEIIQHEVTDEVRATVFSLRSLLLTLALAGIEPPLGILADIRGLSSVYYVLAAMYGVFFIYFAAVGRRRLFGVGKESEPS